MKGSYRQVLYITLGTLSLGLGALGLVLPLLPTTPLWLLTAYLYMNSSPKLYQRVMENRIFGTVVRNFRLYKAIPLHSKVIILTVLWGTILLSGYCVARWAIWVLLLVIAVGVTWHILSYETLTPQLKERKEREFQEAEKRVKKGVRR